MKTFPTLYKKTSTGKVQTWAVSVNSNEDGHGVITVVQGQLDGKKQTYVETIKAGKNIGKKNETSPITQAEAEAAAEWTKKKDRRHYGTDIGATESAAKREEAPMLALVYEKQAKKVDWSNAYGQPKYDGNRCLARNEGGEVTLWSRTGKPIESAPHIIDDLKRVTQPGDVFDGELYIHGMALSALRSLIAREQEGSAKLELRVYDMMTAEPYMERLNTLKCRAFDTATALHLAPTVAVTSEADLMKFQRDCIAEGYEGAMLRWGNFGYEAGKRSSSLLKVKTFLTDEFVITKVSQGKGTFEGMAVFTCMAPTGHEFDVTSPGDLLEKAKHWKNRKLLIGKTLTVKYQNYTVTDKPVPFQPVAIAIRKGKE